MGKLEEQSDATSSIKPVGVIKPPSNLSKSTAIGTMSVSLSGIEERIRQEEPAGDRIDDFRGLRLDGEA